MSESKIPRNNDIHAWVARVQFLERRVAELESLLERWQLVVGNTLENVEALAVMELSPIIREEAAS